MKALALFAVVLALGAYACFTLTLQNGQIACSDDPARLCPTGYSCADMFCWQNTTSTDAGTDASTD